MRNEVYVKFAEAIGRTAEARRIGMQKSAGGFSQLARLRTLLSPKVNAESWGRFDPRRLFTTTRTYPVRSVTNIDSSGNVVGQSTSNYVGRGIPAFGDLARQGGSRTTTRLSPAKILAALGLTGGGALALSAAHDKPKGTLDHLKDAWGSLTPGQKLMTAIAGAGVLTAGTAGVASMVGGSKRS